MPKPNPNPPPESDYITEADLANALGVDRFILREHRPPLDGHAATTLHGAVHWLRKKGADLALTLGLEPPDQVTAPPATPAQGELLTVTSRPGPKGHHFGNPHLIRASRANGELVVVRVVNSAKYVPMGRNGKPMQLRAKPSGEGQWWLLVGREPRYPGAW